GTALRQFRYVKEQLEVAPLRATCGGSLRSFYLLSATLTVAVLIYYLTNGNPSKGFPLLFILINSRSYGGLIYICINGIPSKGIPLLFILITEAFKCFLIGRA